MLQHKSENVRQTIVAMFYLFALTFSLSFPFAIRTEMRPAPFLTLALDDFYLFFALAERVFAALLILHCVQWLVSRRIQTHEGRQNAKSAEQRDVR